MGAVPAPAVLVKTHETFPQMQERFGGVLPGPGPPGAPPLRLFADANTSISTARPEDALVSLFHFDGHRKQANSKAAAGMDAFCRAYLPSWEENVASYLRAEDGRLPRFCLCPTSLCCNIRRKS